MAGIRGQRFVEVGWSPWRVQTHVRVNVLDITLGCSFSRNEELREDSVQVPLEALTVKVFPQFLSSCDVPILSLVVTDPLIVIILVLVKPHLTYVKIINHQDSSPSERLFISKSTSASLTLFLKTTLTLLLHLYGDPFLQ